MHSIAPCICISTFWSLSAFEPASALCFVFKSALITLSIQIRIHPCYSLTCQQLPSVLLLQRPDIHPYRALTSIWTPLTQFSAQDSAQVTLLPYLAISARQALLWDTAPSDRFSLDSYCIRKADGSSSNRLQLQCSSGLRCAWPCTDSFNSKIHMAPDDYASYLYTVLRFQCTLTCLNPSIIALTMMLLLHQPLWPVTSQALSLSGRFNHLPHYQKALVYIPAIF